MFFQPCSWIEQDINYKYTIDTYGRTHEGDIARVRLLNFKPYFYMKFENNDTQSNIQSLIKSPQGKQIDTKITLENKLDVINGFNNLLSIKVWKLEFSSLWAFKYVSKLFKNRSLYESNIPPYLRLFHELDISPSSTIELKNYKEVEDSSIRVDKLYEVSYKNIRSELSKQIPLLILSYDIEVYSDSGQFPMSLNPKDEIIQIGLSLRWTDSLLDSVERYVLVSGTCTQSNTDDLKIISCSNECELLKKFQDIIYLENPDILIGYNTFGFDDGYISDRCRFNRISLNLGREDSLNNTDHLKTHKKTFELASGKYEVKYFDLPGRLTIDLLLCIRREQNLDSYKLDNVSSQFLKDKVLKFNYISSTSLEIHTKSTRGLFEGNFIKLDIITNTTNPYKEGQKFLILSKTPKSFIIHTPSKILDDLTKDELNKLEWSFCKDDISAQQMFLKHKGSKEDRFQIAKYCIQDCDLVLTLIAKLDTFVNACGMADVCKVPIDFIFLRGQGIKIYSAVLYYASKRNQIIQNQESTEEDMSYEGAIVLPPKIGMYLDQPIPVLDFNSLYPTNMIAFNISPDTLIYIKTYNSDGKLLSFEGIKDYSSELQIDEISYDISGGRKTCGYVQVSDSNPLLKGILPLTLDILLKKRKETRKLMETCDDESKISVLNGLQLAYKTVANSVYGQCGSRSSPIRKVEVAACTTALGRARIHDAKTVVENEFGATVIYGDSVTAYTPILIKQNDQIKIINIEELGSEWKQSLDSDKEYCELQNTYSWTDNGWTLIERVIRHKLASHKKVIRILTHGGMVDVTDDHSLLKLDKTEISPKDLNIGDELLHHSYPENNSSINDPILKYKAKIAGFFFGDGSCGIYDCPSGLKASWALNNANMNLLKSYVEICNIAYPTFEWIINNTIESSGVYKLVPRSNEYGSIKKFIETYRQELYIGQRKNIPDWIMNGSYEIRKAFWDGMYDADGDKQKGQRRIDQKHQTTCAQIAYLGNLLGYKVSINDRADKLKIARMTFTENKQSKDPNKIKKIRTIPYEGYVYDLTTSNHHFQAGIGRIIVHNTDSIFVKFPTKDLSESISLAKQAAEKITSLCRKPYKIEYEKTFFPFIIFCRKRYIGLMYEDDITKCKRKFMGIALKRRDSAPIVKDVYGGALDILLEQRSLKNAQVYVRDMLSKLMENKFPLEKYVITKQLRDDYKNPGQIAHRVLADRMSQRDPGNKPQVGDRLAFIYIDSKKDEKKQGDRIEELAYVKSKNLKPDVEFYITNQIQNPLAQLFALGIDQIDGYKEKKYPEFPDLDEEESTLKVLSLKEKELDSLMFMGAQYLKKLKKGPMDKFFTRQQ